MYICTEWVLYDSSGRDMQAGDHHGAPLGSSVSAFALEFGVNAMNRTGYLVYLFSFAELKRIFYGRSKEFLTAPIRSSLVW